ncbi:hypothetical protein ACLMJK_009501 [Lecanora helva]
MNDQSFKHEVLKSLNEFLFDELPGNDILACWQADSLLGKTRGKGNLGNYRIDRERVSLRGTACWTQSHMLIKLAKPPLKYPDRQRFALQVNHFPPDKALRKITRSRSLNGGKFTKSAPTVAQIEVNTYMSQEEGSGADDILREAFYQSMIPDQIFGAQHLHHVYVDEAGQIWVKKSRDHEIWLQRGAEKAQKEARNEAKKKEGKGKRRHSHGF